MAKTKSTGKACEVTMALCIAALAVSLVIGPATAGPYCDRVGQKVMVAIDEASKRSSAQGASAATSVCAAVNIARATVYGAIKCLDDPDFSVAEKAAIRAQLAASRRNVQQNLEVFSNVSSTGAKCPCWSEACSD